MNEIDEVWLPIKNWEGCYCISNMGNVKSLIRPNVIVEKLLRAKIDKYGYPCVTLRKPGTSGYYTIHRLVASAFIVNSDNKNQVNHIDGNKLNNCVTNLEWCTNKENIMHAVSIGLSDFVGEKNPRATISEDEVSRIKEFLRFGLKVCSIRRLMGISESKIQCIKDGKSWRHTA